MYYVITLFNTAYFPVRFLFTNSMFHHCESNTTCLNSVTCQVYSTGNKARLILVSLAVRMCHSAIHCNWLSPSCHTELSHFVLSCS